MTDWVTVKVPKSDRDEAREHIPDEATWGDALVAGAESLADAPEMPDFGIKGDVKPESWGDDADADEILSRLDDVEAAAREATEAAHSAEQSVEKLTEGRR